MAKKEEPIDLSKIRDDDELIEKLRAGGSGDDEVSKMLAALRDQSKDDK